MKKGVQIFFAFLLVINFVAVVLLMLQQNALSTQINNLQIFMEYEIANIEENIDNQISDAVLSADFKVINLSHVIDGYDKQKNVMTGSVTFEIVNDNDVENLSVALVNLSTGKTKSFDAKSLGSLKYTADIQVGYSSDYQYYVISKDADGNTHIRSRKNTIETSPLIHERGHLHTNEVSWSQGIYTADGILFLNDDIAAVTKIEAVISGHEETSFIVGEERHGTVLEVIDITDDLDADYDFDYDVDIWSDLEYEKYAFLIAVHIDKNVYDAYGFVDLTVKVYFEDGTSLTMYQ